MNQRQGTPAEPRRQGLAQGQLVPLFVVGVEHVGQGRAGDVLQYQDGPLVQREDVAQIRNQPRQYVRVERHREAGRREEKVGPVADAVVASREEHKGRDEERRSSRST